MVAIREDVKGEVREDPGQTHGDAGEVVGIAPATEREVDGPVEPPKDVPVRLVGIERRHEGPDRRPS